MKNVKNLLSTLALGLFSVSAMAQWNSNTAVNLEVSAMEASDLQALSTPNGKTWIAFYRNNGGNYEMRAQLLDSAGNKLLGPDGVLVNQHTSGSAIYVFNICLDNKDDLIIAMQDERSVSAAAVIYNVNQAGISQWNGPDGVVLGAGLSPYPASLSNGDIIVAWNNNNKLSMQKISPTGVAAWATPKEFSLGGKATRGQIVPMSDSGFVMAFQKGSFGINTTFYAQRFDNNGDSLWTASAQLTNEATSAARYYSVINDADTTYVGYYSSGLSNHFNSWVQRINPDGSLPYGINGAAFSDYSANSEPGEQTTEIALSPNSPYVWAVSSFSNSTQSEYGTFIQKFKKSDGTRMLNVLGKEVYPIGTDRYAQQGNLALNNDKPVFMVCSDVTYLIKGTALDENGEFLLPSQDVELSSTIIPQPSALNKGRFAFTQNVNGQSVAIWTENRGIENRAYAQNFDLSVYDTSIAVHTENNVPATITTTSGTLQMLATVLPSSLNQAVTWSIVPGTGTATVSPTGLVTAQTNGTVWAKAVSVAAPGYADSMEINIDQPTGINVLAQKMGFKAYPNPTNDILYIEIKESHPEVTIILNDVSGKSVKVIHAKENALNTPLKIKMNDLPQGIYLLNISGKGISINDKIVK